MPRSGASPFPVRSDVAARPPRLTKPRGRLIPLAFAAAAFASSSRSTAIARRRAASSPAGAMLLWI